MNDVGFVPQWIEERQKPKSVVGKIVDTINAMSTPRENGWGIAKIITQIVLGTLLTALAGSAAFTAKTLSNHESRLSVVEEWKRERSARMDEIAKDIGEMKTRNAGVDQQSRATDMLVRDVSAQIRVMSDTLIRMQEGQSAIREKMVSLQVMTDELNKGTK